MTERMNQYLADLEARLRRAGADPAMVHDAIFDAREHLAAALGGDETGAALEEAISEYGAPAEVAAEYLEIERTVERALSPTVAGAVRGAVADPAGWSSLAYLLLSPATGVAYFAVVAGGLGISLSLAVFIIGVPFFLFFIGVVRTVSLVEGRLVEALLRERMPRRPLLAPTESGWLERLKHWLSDRRTWTTIVYLAAQFPLGVAYFVGSVVGFGFSLWMVVGPVVQVVTGTPFLPEVGPAGYSLEAWALLPVMAIGVVALLVVFRVARFVGRLHGRYAKWMLVGSLGKPTGS